jgi:hypothetical protein
MVMKEQTMLLIKEAGELISMMDVDAIVESSTPKQVVIENGDIRIMVTSNSILIEKGKP